MINSSEFKCLKDKCPNNCCHNNTIKLTVIDLLRFNDLFGLSFNEPFYDFNKGLIKMLVDTKTGIPYGVMANKEGACPLLTNGLCPLHGRDLIGLKDLFKIKGLPVSAQPLICRAYPFMIIRFGEPSYSFNSGCFKVPEKHWDFINDCCVSELINEFNVYKKVSEKISAKSFDELMNLMREGRFIDFIKECL